MPGIQLFIDVDALDGAGGIGALEQIVGRCSALLVFMSDGYFDSKNCQRELRSALAYGLPLVLVRETDATKGGLSLYELVQQCPEDLRDEVFAFPVIDLQRVKDFQQVERPVIRGCG